MNALANPSCTIPEVLACAEEAYGPAGAASPGHPLVRRSDEELLGLSKMHTDVGCIPRATSLAMPSSPSVLSRTPEPNPSQGVYVRGPNEPVEATSYPSSSLCSMPSSSNIASSRSSAPMPPPPVPPLRIPSGGTNQNAPAPPVSPSLFPATSPVPISRASSRFDRASPILPRAPPPSPLHSPSATSPRASGFVPESPIAHARRTPSPARTPPMRLLSTRGEHTLTVYLPEGLAPEMVTVCAKKGARLSVVADLWHREHDSHYEWEVTFSPADVDMLSVRAVFEADGQLTIHVRRRRDSDGSPPPRIRTPQ
ncbi:hypothetical protein ACG7TL_006767 [Trametes sanguinea]